MYSEFEKGGRRDHSWSEWADQKKEKEETEGEKKKDVSLLV